VALSIDTMYKGGAAVLGLSIDGIVQTWPKFDAFIL